MADNEHDGEYVGSLFALEIDDVEIGRFTGCSGLGGEIEVIDLPDAANGDLHKRKRPGRVSYDDITLSRGLSADTTLEDWYEDIVKGLIERKNGSIVIYNEVATEIGRWNFENAWPSKWSASDLSAASDDIMIEEVTITHEYLYRA